MTQTSRTFQFQVISKLNSNPWYSSPNKYKQACIHGYPYLLLFMDHLLLYMQHRLERYQTLEGRQFLEPGEILLGALESKVLIDILIHLI
jgi:hypothetical protein